jgi:hypothetical protein
MRGISRLAEELFLTELCCMDLGGYSFFILILDSFRQFAVPLVADCHNSKNFLQNFELEICRHQKFFGRHLLQQEKYFLDPVRRFISSHP